VVRVKNYPQMTQIPQISICVICAICGWFRSQRRERPRIPNPVSRIPHPAKATRPRLSPRPCPVRQRTPS